MKWDLIVQRSSVKTCAMINHLTETDAKRLKVEKDFDWTTLLRMLRNEIYVGDRLIQKAPPMNFLTKKPDLTEEYESKFIENDHEGIVSREVWNQVQERLNREKQARVLHVFSKEQSHFLYGKLFCAECGMPYRRFTAPIASGTHKVWRCTGRRKKNGCKNHQVAEEDIVTLRIRASIATMGGAPSADDLLKAADTIRRAAELVKVLENESLTYTETF